MEGVSSDAAPPPVSVNTRRVPKVLRQERSDHERLMTSVGEAIGAVTDDMTPTTPFERDVQWITDTANARDVDYSHAFHTAMAALTQLGIGMGEWVDGVIRLLDPESPLPTQSATCLRGLMESVLLACHLLEEGISTSQRLARFAACMLHESQQSAHIWTLVNFPMTGDRDPLEWRHIEVAKQSEMGFQHVWSKDGSKVIKVSFDGEEANLTPKATELALKFLPEYPELYPVLSSSSHARIWSGEGMRNTTPEGQTGIVGLQTLWLSRVWAVTLCRYIGRDPQPMLNRNWRRGLSISGNVLQPEETTNL